MADATCSIEGCGRKVIARGWCARHYWRWRKYGDPFAGGVYRDGSPCTVEGCDRPRMGRGFCAKHYQRWVKYGDPLKVQYIRGDDEARFWSKVDRRDIDECWPWLGKLDADGYGVFAHPETGNRAHRFAYELMIGPIPEGLTIDHVRDRGCTRRNCVNALMHMEPVTVRENTMRGVGPSSLNMRKTHCVRGHELTEKNVYWGRNGSRHCRTCALEKERRRGPRNRRRRRSASAD